MARQYSTSASKDVERAMRKRKSGTLEERPQREEGDEPQAGDRHRPLGSAPEGQEGAEEEAFKEEELAEAQIVGWAISAFTRVFDALLARPSRPQRTCRVARATTHRQKRRILAVPAAWVTASPAASPVARQCSRLTHPTVSSRQARLRGDRRHVLAERLEHLDDDALGVEPGLGVHRGRAVLVDEDVGQHHRCAP